MVANVEDLFTEGQSKTKELNKLSRAANTFIDQGIRVIRAQNKKPWKCTWKDQEPITHADVDKGWFVGSPGIAACWGTHSDFAVDLEFDSNFAKYFAAKLLPKANGVFGRDGSPESHHIYDFSVVVDSKSWKDSVSSLTHTDNPKGELFSLRSTGLISMLPPSTHEPTGQSLRWDKPLVRSKQDPQNVLPMLDRIAAMTIYARNYPQEGSRQDATMALAGGLQRLGWEEEETIEFISLVYDVADNCSDLAERAKRIDTVKRTYIRAENGENTTGWKHLIDTCYNGNSAIVSTICNLLGVRKIDKVDTGAYTKYFDSNTFRTARLVDELNATNRFLTVGNNLHIYTDGVYAPDSERVVHAQARALLDDWWDPTHYKKTYETLQLDSTSWTMHNHSGLINVKNGMLNPKTRELLPHDQRYLSVVQYPVKYIADFDCTEIDKFVASLLKPGFINTYWELMGYTMSADLILHKQLKKAGLFSGDADTGKSQLLDLAVRLCGRDNVASAKLQDLANKQFASANLAGKIANIRAEMSANKSIEDNDQIKSLINGDMIEAELKFVQKLLKFENLAVLWFAFNEVPHILSPESSLMKKFIHFKCENHFTEGPNGTANAEYVEHILSTQLPGALLRALEGLNRLYENKAFTSTEATEKARQDFTEEADSVAAYIVQGSELDIDAWYPSTVWYDYFKAYCKQTGKKETGDHTFYRRFAQHATNYGLKEEIRRIATNPKDGSKKQVKGYGGRRILVPISYDASSDLITINNASPLY